MASKTGSFLRKSDRQKILRDLHQKGELTPGSAPEAVRDEAAQVVASSSSTATTTTTTTGSGGNNNNNNNSGAPAIDNVEGGEPFGTGCLSCGRDDDHANLLLCEACEAEYHTYCLDPPLRAVPAGDWFCAECKASMGQPDDDGLEALVNALEPSFTSRFGEVCWAQGGAGFGWWPAFIYDPRLTIGTARELARKNLGKRHLVYFFGCNDAPFSVLTKQKIMKWDDGLIDDYHLGKTARGSGQKRTKNFKEAMQAAMIEMAKPIEMRMDWNHSDQPQVLPSPQPKKVPPPRKRPRREVSPVKRQSLEKEATKSSKSKPRSKPRGFPLITDAPEMAQVPTRRNLNFALDTLRMGTRTNAEAINPIVEPSEDGELVVKLLQKESFPVEGPGGEAVPGSGNSERPCTNVGFLKLASRKKNTFSDARGAIEKELVPDAIPAGTEWRFFVPGLGPVSKKQESIMGPIYSFLRQTTLDSNLGDGTLMHPLKLFIVKLEVPGNNAVAENSAPDS
eukprot:CAMPEP_0172392090 /NCGR_PEP_ID=MMETSP1061-20121228/8328_1 /TAXON_ID=37318 /ORGANISM="Pseudo-nitzschia pungens, Strain cf. pungens" /LENGTH=506 /DNA_ID=CAMNT_0013122865 /DNA_START=310 /DNA_END=1830 /DNA_ORIENTATION=+